MTADRCRLALGGEPLEGERLVRLVYFDEAGISNSSQEPFLVVAAIIIHADEKLVPIERNIEQIVERHIPEHQRSDFAFHATHLFNGGGKVFRRLPRGQEGPEQWPLERRLAIADDLAQLFRQHHLPVALGWVKREDFPSDFSMFKVLNTANQTVAAHVVSFVVCAMQVEAWMRRETSGEVCMLIIEDNEQARSLMRTTQNHYQNPAARILGLSPSQEELIAKVLPFKRIKEDPLFQKKKRSSPLQLADFAAYVFKRVLMGDRRYRRFFEPWMDLLCIIPNEPGKRAP